MSEEKNLLKKAVAGDIKSIKQLAEYCDKKSGRWREEPQVGETISIEELLANADKKADEDCLAVAFKWYLKGAELGDPECMYEVGHRIYDAIGCYKDEEWIKRGKLAFEWYLKAAQAGYVPAMRITAYMYDGLCVDKDEVESFRWYLKAAEAGDEDSACEVAKKYAHGEGVEKNLDEADKWLALLDDEKYLHTLHGLSTGYDKESLMWLERLVELGDPVALKHKAEAYCVGEGIEQDFEKALELFIKAGTSESGNYNPDVLAEALFQAGNLYYTGEGKIKQDYEQALKYYTMSSDKEYIKAYVQCGKMHYCGLGAKKELRAARRFFNRAINTRDRYPFGGRNSNTIALEYLGHIYECGWRNIRRNIELAYDYYEQAAKDTRNQEIIFRLANDYFYGNNVEVDIYKALSYFEEAGRYPTYKYYYEANLKLGWIYKLGENVERDETKAEEYFKKLLPKDETEDE